QPPYAGGVKVRGSRRLKCGELVNDPKVIEETMRLINEFLARVERHKDTLLSDEATPFDESIKALSEWLSRIEGGRINESDDEAITNLRRAMRGIAKKMLKLASQVRERWLREYRRELEELIGRLRSNEARIVISGEPFNKSRSFAVHLYTENITIGVKRVAKSGGVTVIMHLTGLRGFHVITPKLFGDGDLRAMQYGLLLTDGSIDDDGYPVMGTNQLWQVFAWLIAWPGKNHMYINGVGINGDDVGVTWKLIATDHKGVFEGKAVVAEQASELDNEDFMSFLLFAILGDGSVDVERKVVRLYMGREKRDLWGGLIERLRGLGFREKKEKHKITYVVWTSRAVDLVKKMLSETSIKALTEDLSTLPDADKLRRLIELTNVKTKPLGRSSIEVAGIRMNVHVNQGGFVDLIVRRHDYNDAVEVLTRLKNAGYKEVELNKRSSKYVVYMSMNAIKKYPELVSKVCEVLRRMHEKAINEGRERRAKAITKAMTNLNCPPTQSPRASPPPKLGNSPYHDYTITINLKP
ncbi:hypothetical protein, partial [Vulcanisaeta distributa]|uniref:hypothetical protein n=1 Tax=Vulcanisaeta distributa TaxID=164451 RepID=UPI000A3F4D8F